MAKEYSEKSFLCEIEDFSLVESYLKQRNINGFSFSKPVHKRKKNEDTVEAVRKVLREQPDSVQQEIERDFSEINYLANEKGSQNLLAEAKDQGLSLPLDKFVEMNNHDRALWFFNNHPDIFQQADAVQQFYDLEGWKRAPAPTKDIDFILSRKEALNEALRKYYGEKEALGKYGEVEMYPKEGRVYVVARLTGNAENNFVPDEKTNGLIQDGTRRRLFEVYYLYRQNKEEKNNAELEIKARGGYTKQHDLLNVFSKSVFNTELDDSKQTYDLELLKNPRFSMVSDPEDQLEWWWLKALELRLPDGSRTKITVPGDNKYGADAMWERLKAQNLADKMTDAIVNRAELQMKFKTTKKRQKGSVSFYLTWKDTCSLSSNKELHLRAGAILKKSKLDCGFNKRTA